VKIRILGLKYLPRLIRVVSETLCISSNKITLDSDFAEDLGADDLDEVELVMAIEEEFEIVIDEIEAFSLKTVGDAMLLLQSRGFV
jgi:acyl carrier protein